MKLEAKRFKIVGEKNANVWAEELIKCGAVNLRMAKGHQHNSFKIMFDWPCNAQLPSAPRWL